MYDGHPSHGWTQIVEQYDWSKDNSKELAKGAERASRWNAYPPAI